MSTDDKERRRLIIVIAIASAVSALAYVEAYPRTVSGLFSGSAPSVESAAIIPLLNDAFTGYLSHRGGEGTQFSITATKTDGQKTQIAGAEGYRMFLEVTVDLPNGLRAECRRPGARLCFLYEGLPPLEGPAKLTYPATVDLSKTESTWVVNNLNINFSNPAQTQ